MQPGDRQAVHDVHVEAFSQDDEADIVERLWDRGEICAELSLLAVDDADGAVIGHVACSPVLLDGEVCRGIALGPIGVVPDRQGEGIGSQLIEATLAAARAAGVGFVVVLGHPAYYPRFGFRPAAPEGLVGDYGETDAWMAQTLADEHLPRGRISYSSAFDSA